MKNLLIGMVVLALVGCATMTRKTPEVGFKLMDKYDSPDGMTIGPDNYIYLSMNARELT